MRPARRGERVEDGSLPPVAVEAQVGHGQVGLTIGLRGEAHEAVQERAVGRIVRHVGGELGAGHDVDADGDLARGRHRDGRALTRGRCRAGVRQLHSTASPIRGVFREEAAVHDLGQGLGAQLVGRGRRAEVVEGDVEVPARRAIPQVGLGAGGLRRTHDGRVHGRGRGSQSVHEARALLTRGIIGAAVLSWINDRSRGSHDEVLDDVGFLARAHRGEQRVGLDALQDDGADAGHLRGRHGCAGEVVVLAVQDGGIDVAARSGDLGLQAQVGGDAPRGEVGHRVRGARRHGLAVDEGQVVVGGLKHGLAALIGDEGGWHVQCRHAHDHERVAGDVVVDEDASGVERGQVLDLLLEGHLAARDERELAGQAIRVLRLQGGSVLL